MFFFEFPTLASRFVIIYTYFFSFQRHFALSSRCVFCSFFVNVVIFLNFPRFCSLVLPSRPGTSVFLCIYFFYQASSLLAFSWPFLVFILSMSDQQDSSTALSLFPNMWRLFVLGFSFCVLFVRFSNSPTLNSALLFIIAFLFVILCLSVTVSACAHYEAPLHKQWPFQIAKCYVTSLVWNA